jgi:hypothetical protein
MFDRKSISDGIDGTKRNFENIFGLVMKLLNFLWKVFEFAFDAVYKMVEMIPIAE